MGALIVVLSGVVGLVCAVISYMLGANLLWTFGIYVFSGHAMSTILLYRYAKRSETQDPAMEQQIEMELSALREYQETLAEQARTQSTSLFSLLRNSDKLARQAS